MNGGRNKCIFTWFIENYSHSWHNNGEELASPEFTSDVLEKTVWTLKLYPRGCGDSGYISILLKRKERDNGPEDFQLMFKFSLLRSDGTGLHAREWKYTFRKGSNYKWYQFIKREEVLSEGNEEYLPQDTLSVRCEMWRGDGSIQKQSHIFARTRIAIEQVSFLHVAENFSAIEPNQKKTVNICSASKKAISFSISLYFTDGSCCEEKIIMEMTPFGANQILTNCKISLIDGSGKFIECGAADNRFDETRTDIKKMPLFLTRKSILERNNEYLPNDKLSLLCNFIFSTGVIYEKMGSALRGKCVVAQNQMNKSFQYSDIYNADEKLSTCLNALDDLKAVYDDQLLTDVKLKTKTKSFSAHKILLCARSSVFKAMLTNDMKEKNTNSIQVDDLENDTVQQLLLFMYSDSIQILQWKSAIQLYYAADKYEIEKLKVMCSSFLVDNLNTSNVSELLLLSDTHNDSNLKKVAEEFIFNHEKLVYSSEEWEHLIETNPKLASKTMLEMCKRKI